MTYMSRYRELNDLMEFDHVIRVHEDGGTTDEPGIYAPDLNGDEQGDSRELLGSFHGIAPPYTRDRWVLMNGYSGQDRYAGPIMHNSEFIGGAMERDILATPGVYVALVCSWFPDEDDEMYAEGWAVARYEGRVSVAPPVCADCGQDPYTSPPCVG